MSAIRSAVKGLWVLVRDAVRPAPPLRATNDEIQASRIDAEHEMEARLKATEDGDRDLLIATVKDGYHEQDRRSDQSERRATLMLGAVGVITALVGATAGILGQEDLADDVLRRLGFGIPLVIVIACFGLAVLYAVQVIVSRDQWRRPATPTMLRDRVTKTGERLYKHTVAALIESATWNQHIADCKAGRLHRASRCFATGLIGLVVIAVVFVGVTIVSPTKDAAPAPTAGQRSTN